MKRIEEEKKYLELVKKRIVEERKEQIENLKRIPWEYKGRYAEVKWGDEDLVETLTNMCSERLKKIKNLENNPYFGSFTFDNHIDETKTFRLGKTDVTNNANQLVLDWRNPICTLYYDQSIGSVSYEAPLGTVYGDLINKSQILIQEGDIKSIRDIDLVSDDELLQPYLDVHADSRMKTIIASIQTEQNNIIRKPLNQNLIIQGVAGSGKTSVALHRIAYLLYNNSNKNIDSSKFIIIGPNKYFLNYISSILPDLDTQNTNEYTFDEIAKEVIGEADFTYETSNEELSHSIASEKNNNAKSFKGTLQYKKCLERFLRDYFSLCLSGGIKFDDLELISEETLKRGLIISPNYSKTINDYIKLISKITKENWEKTYYELGRPLAEEMKKYPPNSEERIALNLRMNKLKETLKKGCISELRKFIKPLLIRPVQLYKLFLENIDKYIDLSPEEANLFKQESLKMLKKKTILYEDLAGICYLSLLYNCSPNYEKYRHIVIDEAQDYNLFQFDVLKTAFSKSTFSIFGDLAQAIYSYRTITSWSEVQSQIFNGKCERLDMLKSYRTTKEITNASNYVLRKLNLSEATPVIRIGEDIAFCEYTDESLENQYLSKINNFMERGYKSVGIICKDEIEMQEVKSILEKLQIPYNYVTNTDKNYNGGISIMTSYLAKGLEFDAVIINNACEEKYASDSKIDMHLLYVAMTRALHQLDIFYKGNLNNVLLGTLKEQLQEKEKNLALLRKK